MTAPYDDSTQKEWKERKNKIEGYYREIGQVGTSGNEKIVTNGGRVLGVTALGDTLDLAIKNAYGATEKISWKNKYSRMDIGKKGLIYL